MMIDDDGGGVSLKILALDETHLDCFGRSAARMIHERHYAIVRHMSHTSECEKKYMVLAVGL